MSCASSVVFADRSQCAWSLLCASATAPSRLGFRARRTGGCSSSQVPTDCCSTPRSRRAARTSARLATFQSAAGQEVGFVLNWSPSFLEPPPPLRCTEALKEIESFWSGWSETFKPQRALGRRGPAFALDAEGADALADGRNRRGRDDVSAREERAARGTGIIASAGSATPPSPSRADRRRLS